MQLRQFRHLSTIERKAKFIEFLIRRTEGRLESEELKAIAEGSFQHEEEDKFLFSLPELKINIRSDPKLFAQIVTLRRTGVSDSWEGKKIFCQYGNWILGEGEFGNYTYVEQSYHGEIDNPESYSKEPDFDLDRLQAVVIKSVFHDSLSDPTLHESEYALSLLFPATDYVIEPQIAEIISRFNLT